MVKRRGVGDDEDGRQGRVVGVELGLDEVDEEAMLVPELNEGAAPESEDVLAKEAL